MTASGWSGGEGLRGGARGGGRADHIGGPVADLWGLAPVQPRGAVQRGVQPPAADVVLAAAHRVSVEPIQFSLAGESGRRRGAVAHPSGGARLATGTGPTGAPTAIAATGLPTAVGHTGGGALPRGVARFSRGTSPTGAPTAI